MFSWFEYLNRLGKIGLRAGLFVVAGCANAVLRRAHADEGPVGEH